MIIHYNVWKIFYLILISAFLVFSILLYFSFANINQRHHTEVEYYAEIISKTLNAKLLQNEMMLETIGKQLLKNNSYKNSEKTQKLLDSLLKKNPSLAAFGLVDINGNIIASSSNIKLTKKVNLLHTNRLNNDFKDVLQSKDMCVGRTYYFAAIDDWVIPMRKAIRDENGIVIGVMTSGLKNSKNNNYLDTLQLSKKKNVVLILDTNRNKKAYRIYFSNAKNISNEMLYTVAIPSELYNHVAKVAKDKYNFTIEDVRENGKTVTFEGSDAFGVKKISAIIYDKEYHLWVVVHIEKSELWEEFFDLLFIYTILFIIIFILFFILFKNIATSEKRKKNELVFQAQHDALTKLPNRAYMYDHIETWLSKYSDNFYVLYIDLDNFKNINDKFGHTIGDSVLIEVAKRLQDFFDDESMIIRQGGDEFIILKYSPTEEVLEDSFKDLISLISKVYYIESKEFRIGMSLGVAQYPKDANDIEELLSLADTAMYEAKKKRNSYCFFSEYMRYRTIVKADMEQELRGAIEREELWIAYQPQMNSDGTLHGVEALVRWNNKTLGLVGPAQFISIAEDAGLIRDFGKFILHTALKEIQNIHKEFDITFNLSINISPIELSDVNFLETLLSHIDDIEYDKSYLTLEITESQSIEDLDEVLPLLHAIRAEGIELSLDDFGTGYSSLSILRELPINELKIDKAFIDKILYDKKEKALIQSIINIGKNFGMKTVAEGVESIEQILELKEANCDIFQGYYYSKPLSKKDLRVFLQEGK